jgi:AcrR family transcriptional regulator
MLDFRQQFRSPRISFSGVTFQNPTVRTWPENSGYGWTMEARAKTKSAKTAEQDLDESARRNVRLDILEAMLRLENEKGHLAWKISDLARLAGVSRTLVYYHFGRTKPEMLDAGIELIAVEYFGLTDERATLVREGKGWESVRQTREMIRSRPAFAVFYLRWRMQPRSPIAAMLVAIEQRYQAMLATAFPKLSKHEIVALHGILYGVVMSPFLTDEAIDVVQKLVRHL